MKMETVIHAERDGTIAEVLVKAGRPDRRQGSSAGSGRQARHFGSAETVSRPAVHGLWPAAGAIDHAAVISPVYKKAAAR
jgi:hypothetical protein